jgi:hypothetical protein
MSPSLQPLLPTNKTKASPSDEDLHYSIHRFIFYCGASELKQQQAFLSLKKREKKKIWIQFPYFSFEDKGKVSGRE